MSPLPSDPSQAHVVPSLFYHDEQEEEKSRLIDFYNVGDKDCDRLKNVTLAITDDEFDQNDCNGIRNEGSSGVCESDMKMNIQRFSHQS